MKRLACVLIAALMLLPAAVPIPASAVTVYDYAIISQGKQYTFSKCYTGDGSMGYQQVSGSELTDGKIASDDYGTDWIAFDSRIESPLYATIDLGKTVTNIGKMRVYLTAQPHSGIDRPNECVFYVSDDGVTFTKLGEGVYDEDARNTWCTLDLGGSVSGRYVKVSFGTGSQSGVFVFCSEFEVYSIEGSDVPVAEIPGIGLSDGSYLELSNKLLTRLIPGDTAEFLLKNLDSADNIAVYSRSGSKITGTRSIGTGCYLLKEIDGTEIERITCVLDGDISGDGRITVTDYLCNLRLEKGTAEYTGAYLAAAVGSAKIKSYCIGVTDLFDEYIRHPRVPDVTVDGYGSYVMSLTKNSDSMYTVACTADNGKKLTLTFDKKSWGTWNIGTLTCGGTMLAGGGTDWEYVFRAQGAANGFSGGNHGNEKLVDITFYDGKTDKKLAPENGKTIEGLTEIKIIENTLLHLGDDTKCYAAVTRTYTVYGQSISLECDFRFLTDMSFSLSYTCMFPVLKTVGLYCAFRNDDGSENVVTTLEVGLADYSGPMYKDNAASECVIWGKKNKDYAFVVRVLTPEDSCDNYSNFAKTFYWDMNTTTNKLYFSRFPDSAYEKVTAGTEWHTKSDWTLFCLTEETK